MTLADQAAMMGRMVRCPGSGLAGRAAGAEEGIRTPEMAQMEKMFAFALTEPDVRGPPAGDDGSVTVPARAVAAVNVGPQAIGPRFLLPAARGLRAPGHAPLAPVARQDRLTSGVARRSWR